MLIVFFSCTSSPAPLVVSNEQADGQEETPAQQQARMSASSATRELDELMASLSDFKVQSNVSVFVNGVYFWLISLCTFWGVHILYDCTVDE